MFKLIESNGNGIKEILSNGTVVWKIESDIESESKITSFTRDIFLTLYRTTINIKNLPDDFDYFEYRGVRVDNADITRVSSSLARTTHRTFLRAIYANKDYGRNTTVKFYKKAGGGVILNRLPLLFANIVLQKAVA